MTFYSTELMGLFVITNVNPDVGMLPFVGIYQPASVKVGQASIDRSNQIKKENRDVFSYSDHPYTGACSPTCSTTRAV